MLTVEQAHGWYPIADLVHGFDHIQRVYHLAEHIALAEGADLEIVRAAALLHDAEGQVSEGSEADRITHQHTSASFARQILLSEGWGEERILSVQHCIRSHRFRDNSEPPHSLEAQVLFDADKLDAIGAIGVVRAITYAAQRGLPAFAPPSKLFILEGQCESGEVYSAYHEYLFKLSKLKERFYTATGRDMADKRHHKMAEFFDQLQKEMSKETGV
jgi:uncharacterized protein